ncbi:hypothetical protein [Streptococcus sp. NLN64]|uniref:hypothetical protein n=1 Tax=Streptococcus sp. NLN64 TaxID=2822799 RepID=UPI0018CBD4BE|nr:hypothetical protein [Streptococcus sp. NLN64]MBG9367008.1 hypothetical protein [Streptococcus sp. NLN64]
MKLFWGIVILVVASFFVVMILSTDSEENSHREIDAQASSDKDSDEEVSSPIFKSFEEDYDFWLSASNLFLEEHTYSDGIIRELDEKSSDAGASIIVFWEQLETRLNNYLEIHPTDIERMVLLDRAVTAKDEFSSFYMLRNGKEFELLRMTTNFLITYYPEQALDYEEAIASNIDLFGKIEIGAETILLALNGGELFPNTQKSYIDQYTRIHKIYQNICANLTSIAFKNQIYKEKEIMGENEEFEIPIFVVFAGQYSELQGNVLHSIDEEESFDFKPFDKLFQKTIKTNRLDRKLLADN